MSAFVRAVVAATARRGRRGRKANDSGCPAPHARLPLLAAERLEPLWQIASERVLPRRYAPIGYLRA